MPTCAARSGRGNWTCSRWSSRRRMAEIETGLIQRARLLNLVLADTTGRNGLFKHGLLPPALLHANPGFCGLATGFDRRTKSICRCMPWTCARAERALVGAHRPHADSQRRRLRAGESHHPLADSRRAVPGHAASSGCRLFRDPQKAGATRAPWADSPSVVLLTPGPTAKHISNRPISRVTSAIRWSKAGSHRPGPAGVYEDAPAGLQPVDVIVRRVDDKYCDPLELRKDSILGVPGLVEAARAGRVLSPMRSAPAAARPRAARLSARPLPALARGGIDASPSPPGGAARNRRNYVLGHLDALVVKRAFRAHARPRFGENLTPRSANRSARASNFTARLRRPGKGAALHRAGLDGGRSYRARSRCAFIWSPPATATRSCPAGSPASRRPRKARRFHATRRREQGHLGFKRLAGRGPIAARAERAKH